jgi:hypothetical protein
MPGKLSSRGRPESTTDQHLTTTYEPPVTTEAPPSVRGVNASKALDSFRRKLLDRGVCGLMQLTEAFRGSDRDSSHTLSLTEFSAACSELALGLSAVETRALFKHFDTDNSNSIDYKEFCTAVRGPMNSFKKQVVLAVCELLDPTSQNRVDLEVMVSKYDGRRHPEVKQGRATPREVSADSQCVPTKQPPQVLRLLARTLQAQAQEGSQRRHVQRPLTTAWFL